VIGNSVQPSSTVCAAKRSTADIEFNWWSRSCIKKILVIAIPPTPVALLRFLVLCLNSHQLLWPLSSLLPLIYQLLFCSVFGSFSEALFGAPDRLRVDSGSALGRFRVGSGWFPGGLWVVSGSIPGPLRLVSGLYVIMFS
jgi:hypothetical protein